MYREDGAGINVDKFTYLGSIIAKGKDGDAESDSDVNTN